MPNVPIASAADVPNASYRSLLDVCGSHIAAKGAGTYGFGQGAPLAITGIGVLSPLNVIRIVGADYPTIGTLAPKLRIRGRLFVNAAAPTGTYQLALVPVTRPAAGGAGAVGLLIYTLGAAVTGSNTNVLSAPAAGSANDLVGSDFALPADGDYALALISTGTVATSSLIHVSAILQMRNA